MTASLADIDTALLAALSPLAAGPPTTLAPFALVGRYAGPVTEETLREAVAQWPCALLRFDQETSTRLVEVWSADSDDRAIGSWTVLVGVEDPASLDDAMNSAAPRTGSLQLVAFVLAACNALLITGSWQGLTVRYAETRAELIKRGAVYVWGVRFEVRREVETATNVDPAALLPYVNPIDGDVNLEGTTDAAPNPLVQFESEPNP